MPKLIRIFTCSVTESGFATYSTTCNKVTTDHNFTATVTLQAASCSEADILNASVSAKILANIQAKRDADLSLHHQPACEKSTLDD